MAESVSQGRSPWAVRFISRGVGAFALATVASAFTYYFNSRRVDEFNFKQQQLIRRVQADQTSNEFHQRFNAEESEQWVGKKVSLDGVIGAGRFLVKRNRGKQEGYNVLAPFVVSSTNPYTIVDSDTFHSKDSNRKFILNLGWIPRSRKHLAFETISNSAFGQETYETRQEAVEKQNRDGLVRDPLTPNIVVPVTNVTAYIRKGEEEDFRNGRTNWHEQYLYKFIDLNLLSRVFRISNEKEGEAVYLERTIKTEDEPEIIPIAATKATVIQDLHTQSTHFEKNATRSTIFTSTLAFGLATWIAL